MDGDVASKLLDRDVPTLGDRQTEVAGKARTDRQRRRDGKGCTGVRNTVIGEGREGTASIVLSRIVKRDRIRSIARKRKRWTERCRIRSVVVVDVGERRGEHAEGSTDRSMLEPR